MAKEITKKVMKRENKSILQNFKYEDLMIVYEELQIMDSALRGLWATTMATDDERLKSDNYKWLIEMGVGKATQRTDITTDGEKITAGIFIDGEDI